MRNLQKQQTENTRPAARGYALLDIILALTIFSFAVTGLVVLLQKCVETSGSLARDRLIQSGLDSFLTETKRKPVREMNSEYFDESLAVQFRAEVEKLDLANVDGNGLDDLYRIIVTAEFTEDGELQQEVAELYIHQPEER